MPRERVGGRTFFWILVGFLSQSLLHPLRLYTATSFSTGVLKAVQTPPISTFSLALSVTIRSLIMVNGSCKRPTGAGSPEPRISSDANGN